MVSNIFYFDPYLGKISTLTNIFQMGWNHQQEKHQIYTYMYNDPEVDRLWYGFNPATEKKNESRKLPPTPRSSIYAYAPEN